MSLEALGQTKSRDSGLLGSDAASLGELFPTSRKNAVPSSQKFKPPIKIPFSLPGIEVRSLGRPACDVVTMQADQLCLYM
jgi:hypothetical protein